jgi:1,4-alpha-glucan branching enzyme
VRNFLLASALYWLDEFHIDGLRVDAVASMLYLDYSREEGQWIPNRYGGRENLEAIEFLRWANAEVRSRHPGALMIAEESTAWPGVTQPPENGGLGFHLKWNMGWMNDFLRFIEQDSVYRKYHMGLLTFSLMYAFSERFMLPLSHDEVVHGKRSLLSKMPGDEWQRFANLRLALGFMWTHPGKKLLFMGGELGEPREWSEERSLEWHQLEEPLAGGMHRFMRDLNRLYREESALWSVDFSHTGFDWIDFHDTDNSVLSFLRRDDEGRALIAVFNFTPIVREQYRVGVPEEGEYVELLNSDAEVYGGSNQGNMGAVRTEETESHGRPCSLCLTLPPLGFVLLRRRA